MNKLQYISVYVINSIRYGIEKEAKKLTCILCTLYHIIYIIGYAGENVTKFTYFCSHISNKNKSSISGSTLGWSDLHFWRYLKTLGSYKL
jgi:hypothetical protein